jgi:hypothetical protein
MRPTKFAAVLVVVAVASVACSAAPRPGGTTVGQDAPTLQPVPTDSSGAPITSHASGKAKSGSKDNSLGAAASSPGAPGSGPAVPPGPGAPSTAGETFHLFPASTDTTGIDGKTIRLCAHAALTYGSAFVTTAKD